MWLSLPNNNNAYNYYQGETVLETLELQKQLYYYNE